jgi:hypothetical protein
MLRPRANLTSRLYARALPRRYFSTPRPGDGPAPAANPTYTRILNRTPKFLRPTVAALHNAPVTHITAFLLLHEVTAVVPLLGLAGAFHYYHWLPPYFAEGAWVVAGVEKFGRYFRRKGWIGDGEEVEAEWRAKDGKDLTQVETTRGLKWWNRGEGGMRWVVEFGTAYAIVKALLPVRILVSVWGAPWFARWTVIPISNVFKRLFSKKPSGRGGVKQTANAGGAGSNKTGSP